LQNSQLEEVFDGLIKDGATKRIPRKLGMTEDVRVCNQCPQRHPERSEGSPAMGTYSIHARLLNWVRNLHVQDCALGLRSLVNSGWRRMGMTEDVPSAISSPQLHPVRGDVSIAMGTYSIHV